MQLEGWKCLECGVVYAPFVKECRCSVKMVKIQGNMDADHACFHNWPDSVSPCTKCGIMMTSPVTFDFQPYVVQTPPCQHLYDDSSLTTAARLCTKCGMQEVRWEKPGTVGGTKEGGTING